MRKRPDLTGQRFGKLLVIRFVGNDRHHHHQWICKCDCNPEKEIVVVGGRLLDTRKGQGLRSCFECGRFGIAKNKRLNLIGKEIGKLTVLQEMPSHVGEKKKCRCRCKCGQEVIVEVGNILRETKACQRCKNKIAYGLAAFNKIYCVYKYWATKRNLSFDLSKEQFRLLTKGCCHYCGASPSQLVPMGRGRNHGGNYVYNGIDRLDSKLGYSPENAVTSCGMCNELKNSLSVSEFISTVNLIYQYGICGENKIDNCKQDNFLSISDKGNKIAFKMLYARYRCGAKGRGLLFTLSMNHFHALTKQPCYYCGRLPSGVQKYQSAKLTNSGEYVYNGIDRISSDCGYVIGNVRAACRICNRMKVDYTENEFLSKIQEIYHKSVSINLNEKEIFVDIEKVSDCKTEESVECQALSSLVAR
jgi:hypothetical protein